MYIYTIYIMIYRYTDIHPYSYGTNSLQVSQDVVARAFSDI